MRPVVVPYDSNWPSLFEEERDRLSGELSGYCRDVSHFGSTSIPGMHAKPIIDIQMAVGAMPNAEQQQALLRLGYVRRPVEGVDPALYQRFDRGDPVVTHCLHLRLDKSDGTRNDAWRQSVAMREYLRRHPADQQLYSETKLRILGDGEQNVTMLQYRQAKLQVLDEISTRAKQWTASLSDLSSVLPPR